MAGETKTVLLAWELGEGLGHLPPLKAIASALQREGVRVVFALRDPTLARTALGDLTAEIVQAPSWSKAAWPTATSGTYADILVANGYGAAASIRSLVGAWDQILDAVKPALLVCEHAPGAALAAFGRIPVAMVGNGFTVPPADGAEFPSYEPTKPAAVPQRPVLEALQEALGAMGRRAPSTICEPFHGVFRGAYTLPALDPYGHARREPVLGPIEAMPPLTDLPAQRRLFAYSAANYPAMDELIVALMDLGREASVFVRGAPGARTAVLRSRGVTVWESAPDLGQVLVNASVVFSHGGSGFSQAALAAGRPHIIAPRHLEARLTAQRLEAMGVGVAVNPFDVGRFNDAFKHATTAAFGERATAAATTAHSYVERTNALRSTVAALRRSLD